MTLAVPRNVLVVDDEPLIANTLATILRNQGYVSEVAYSAEEALQRVEAFTPDLLISDVMMPGMSGVDLAIELRRRFAQCKVLLFSGVASSADLLEKARAMGYEFMFLSKPVHPKELLRVIQ